MLKISSKSKPPQFAFLCQPASLAAPRLLGCEISRQLNGQLIRGKIVETEAYDQADAASHSYRGVTPRTEPMFGPAGFAYVYFSYGMHYCLNVVVGSAGYGAAVLIRALEPVEGLDLMHRNRGSKIKNDINLCSGPAKLCQAFAIGKSLSGHDLNRRPLQLIIKPPLENSQIASSRRIGISHASDKPWRFFIQNNRYVSPIH
ncbi:MAG: DNA-3-methyladenine glycosylase [Candidatus Saccharimonadales bacterium]